MRLIPSLFTILWCSLILGCAQCGTVSPKWKNVSLQLDNHGGYSHAGRRIALHSNGSYADTNYTDVISDKKVETGVYTLDAEQTHLTLSPVQGPAQHLYRVDYAGQQYWVQELDRHRITQLGETWFRKITLRGEQEPN